MIKQYKIIKLPKGGGNFRTIYAPSKAYKEKLQTFLLDLQQKVHDADRDGVVQGFLRGRGPVSNALKHIGYSYTLSLDITDFFDSVKAEMVEEYLSKEELELCFINGVARQGLPTSPLIANLAMLKLDRQIKNAIEEEGIYTVYTRYADDLIFSFNNKEFASTLTSMVEKILTDAGFRVNRKKTKLQSARSGRRMVTGIGVGERAIYPSRKIKRKARAAIHQKKREAAFGLLSWAECKEPKAFYTDRDLLNKNIFHDDALDISNDFYLSDLLSFEQYVEAVEHDFDGKMYQHETDPGKWARQKKAFLAQRDAFYQQEKKRAAAEREKTRKDLEKHFSTETQEKKEAKQPPKNRPVKEVNKLKGTTEAVANEERSTELNVDFETLKEIEQAQAASFQDEKKARRREKEKIEQITEEKEEKKRVLNKVFVAALLPIIVVIGALSYYFSATEVEIKPAYPLFVKVTPYDARVQIMNIIDKYKMGIELKPGKYDVRISKKGYVTRRFWVTMEHEPVVVEYELKKIKKRKVY